MYGDGLNVRDWIHVADHCRAIRQVIEAGTARARCTTSAATTSRRTCEITQRLLEALGCGEEMIQYVKDRLGHDRRYAIDSSKITSELGWRPQVAFADGLEDTIDWYRRNEALVAPDQERAIS